MRFQERDGDILRAIDSYDGVMAKRHIQTLFWSDKTERAMLKRLQALVEANYLCRPSNRDWRIHPIPEAIYWIGWRGAWWLAAQRGIEVDPPKNLGENQLRTLERSLRNGGFRWVREPKWSNLRHDILVVDFRLALEWSVNELPSISLEQWINESVFRAQPDRVSFRVEGKDGKISQRERGVIPDGFLLLSSEERRQRGVNSRFPALVEVDMAMWDNPRFGRDKAKPGVAYIKSPPYKARFGFNTGVWLVVTTGKRRMRNLMNQTEETVGQDARYFFFCTFSDLGGNILTEPIWWQVGRSEPRSLLSE